MRVSIFGLGYVGAVSCGCFAKDGHDVLGVDISPDKVELINRGMTPVIEDQIGDIIATAVEAGTLKATTDVAGAVAATDVSIISVGTPSADNGSIDLAAIQRVCEQLGDAIKAKGSRHLVIVRSTVMPGTCRRVVIPTLEKAVGAPHGQAFGVCFNPEFLREGSSVADHYNPPYTLIGSDRREDAEQAAELYAGVDAAVHFSSLETAEMVKYVCNAFHALKITFANEMGLVAQSLGVDSHQVMELVCHDTKLNISPKYLKPGFAFGGSCLPKDVKALLYQAKRNDLELPMTAAIMTSNRAQIDRVLARIVKAKTKKVAILGLSFKAGTDDLRESPLVTLTEALIGKGFDIKIYDRNISLARLVGANKRYIEKEIPHISELLVGDLRQAVSHGEVLVVGNGAPEFAELPSMCRAGQIVFDLTHIPALRQASGIDYRGVVW
jgi:GDP-mannose 6-dehydrogenase